MRRTRETRKGEKIATSKRKSDRKRRQDEEGCKTTAADRKLVRKKQKNGV